MHNYVR